MFSKSKRVIGVALAALMIASAFSGCGGGDDSSSKGEGSSAGASTADSSAAESTGDGSAAQTDVKALTIEDIMADAQMAMGDEGVDEEVNLKVWAPPEAVETFKEQCDRFAANFSDRKLKIEVTAQGEDAAATQLINDPDTAADVFGFVSDQASKLFPKYTAQLRANFIEPMKEVHLEGAMDVVQYQEEGKDSTYYAYPETGDNGYVLYYNKSMITEEQVGSLESIMEVCAEKNKNIVIDMKNGFYACMIPLTGGGTYSLNEKAKQVLDYDYKTIGPVAKAFSNLLAGNKNFTNDEDKIMASAMKNEKALACVVGSWKTTALKTALGENYATAKLPTINVDGTDTQIKSMFGYKCIGVNAKTKYQITSQSLAYYLSSEECQKERIEALEWGPSISSLIESDLIQNNDTLKSFYDQQQYSVAQTGLAGSFWDPTGAFGKYLTDEKSDLSDKGIEDAYNKMVKNITT